MQTRHLKTLVQISRVESFATAANQLNMTLSTVSMQMKTLEQELGVELFDRNYRPPKLTPIGRDVAQKATAMLKSEADLLQSCNLDSELSGTYHIGFVATASVRLLPSFLKRARENAPSARFEVETALSEVLERKVMAGQLDAAILTASNLAEPGLNYRVLRKEPLVFAAPAKFKNAAPGKIAQEIPFLQFNPGSGIGKIIANQVRKLTVKASNQPIVLDSVEAIMECVNEGIGFTLLAEPDVKRYANPSVNIFEPSGKSFTRELVLATLRRETGRSIDEPLAELFGF